MEIKNQPKLRFKGVDFINVNFGSSPYKKINKAKIDIKVDPQVFYPIDKPNIFKIIMKVNLSGQEHFRLELIAIGNFEISSKKVPEQVRKSFVNANAPAIMFPYVRAFIASFTANLGNTLGAINIPTKFFKGEIKEFSSEEESIDETMKKSLK